MIATKTRIFSTRCTRRDLNPHTLRCRNLNPVRLPIPPLVLFLIQEAEG